MSVGCPCLSSSIEGTVESGARSETVETVRARPGRHVLEIGGGDDESMPVEDVGTGVGYFWVSFS